MTNESKQAVVKVHPARSVVPAATASKSTNGSAKKPAAPQAKTSNSRGGGKGLFRKARNRVAAQVPIGARRAGLHRRLEPWQAAIAKRLGSSKHVPGVPNAVRRQYLFYGGAGLVPRLRSLPAAHQVQLLKGGSLKAIGKFTVGSLDARGQARREVAADLGSSALRLASPA
jgi:hypothetical protein